MTNSLSEIEWINNKIENIEKIILELGRKRLTFLPSGFGLAYKDAPKHLEMVDREIAEYEQDIKELKAEKAWIKIEGSLIDTPLTKKKEKYDYAFWWIKIKIGKEFVFSQEDSIKSISDYELIKNKIGVNGTPTWLDTRLRRSLGMLYAILKTNSAKLNKKSKPKHIEFMIDHVFWTAFKEFTKKFKDIVPAWNNKEVQKKPYEDYKVASNYVSALREVLKTLTNIKIPDKWEKKDRNNPFFYSLSLEE